MERGGGVELGVGCESRVVSVESSSSSGTNTTAMVCSSVRIEHCSTHALYPMLPQRLSRRHMRCSWQCHVSKDMCVCGYRALEPRLGKHRESAAG